jgi:hypothetical protein
MALVTFPLFKTHHKHFYEEYIIKDVHLQRKDALYQHSHECVEENLEKTVGFGVLRAVIMKIALS